jgi:hypothetical protein
MQRLWLIALLLGLAQPASANTQEFTRQLLELQQATRVLDSRIQKLESSLQQNQQMLGLLKEVEALKAEVAKAARPGRGSTASDGYAGQAPE